MEAWKNGLLQILEPAFGEAGSVLFYVLIAVALIVHFFVLPRAAKTMGIERREWRYVTPATVLGVILFLVGCIAVKLYVPLGFIPSKCQLPVIVTVATLTLLLPAFCLFLRANYVKVFLSVLMSLAAAAMVVAMVLAIANAVMSGGKAVNPVQSRKQEVEDIVNR